MATPGRYGRGATDVGALVKVTDYTADFIGWQADAIRQVAKDSPDVVNATKWVGHGVAVVGFGAAFYHFY